MGIYISVEVRECERYKRKHGFNSQQRCSDSMIVVCMDEQSVKRPENSECRDMLDHALLQMRPPPLFGSGSKMGL